MRKKLLLVLAMLVPLIGFSVEKQKTASVRCYDGDQRV